ncbi:hypothetical protein FQR65_LT16638 [Abscondita terminalis]|nr:hypothetical protein FQR65_LT16638 [Abscondita terminalis]
MDGESDSIQLNQGDGNPEIGSVNLARFNCNNNPVLYHFKQKAEEIEPKEDDREQGRVDEENRMQQLELNLLQMRNYIYRNLRKLRRSQRGGMLRGGRRGGDGGGRRRGSGGQRRGGRRGGGSKNVNINIYN